MKIRDGFNALIKVFYIEFFIWAMQVITIKAKAHENYFDTKLFLKQCAIGMLPPPRTGIGALPKVVSIAFDAAL
jgi:hypothetical protein